MIDYGQEALRAESCSHVAPAASRVLSAMVSFGEIRHLWRLASARCASDLDAQRRMRATCSRAAGLCED
jgi:hypothetical protein